MGQRLKHISSIDGEDEIILLIEAATDSCSVALSRGELILAEKFSAIPKAHDTLLATMVNDILSENSLRASDMAAVAVSSGPGSYMGLRIATSLAKGLAFGADIKLIGVGTLAVIAQCAIDNELPKKFFTAEEDLMIVPMIDAGRDEVYTATFTAKGKELSRSHAKILTKESYNSELQHNIILFTGDGAEKFEGIIKREGAKIPANAFFCNQIPHASGLRVIASDSLKNNNVEDVAYFQPLYLKEFVPGKPKKIL